MSNSTYYTRDDQMMPLVEDVFVDRAQSFDPKLSTTLTPIEELGNPDAVGTDKAPAKVAATLTVNEVGFQLENLFSYPPAEFLVSGVSFLSVRNFTYGNMQVAFKDGVSETITHTYVLPKMTVTSADYSYAYDAPGTESLTLQGTFQGRRKGAYFNDRYDITASQAATYTPVVSSTATGSKYTLWAYIYDETDATFSVVELEESSSAPNEGQIQFTGGNWVLNATDVTTYAGKQIKVGYITADAAAAVVSSGNYNFSSPGAIKGVYVVATYGGTLKASASATYQAGYSPSTDNIDGGYELRRCQAASLNVAFTAEDVGELGSQVRDGVDIIATATQLDNVTGTLDFNETDEIVKLLNYVTNQAPGTTTEADEYTFSQFLGTESLHISLRDIDDTDTVLKEFWIPKITFADDGGITGSVGAFVTKSYAFQSSNKRCYIKSGKMLAGDIPSNDTDNRD